MQKIKKLRFKEVRQLINESASMFKDKTAYYEKVNGNIVGHSFEDIKNDVSALGNDLLKRGFKNKHIAIIGENSYSWIISYLAVVGAVGVAVPLDKELYEEQIADLICKGDVSAVIFSDTFFDDINPLKNLTGVKDVMPSYSADLLVRSGERNNVVKVHALPSLMTVIQNQLIKLNLLKEGCQSSKENAL